VQLRLPWALLGYADPSSGALYAPQGDGSVRFPRATPVRVTVTDPAGRTSAGAPYRVPGWNRVRFTERRKAGWATVRSAFSATAR
jgi:hypothetical protein